MKRKNKSILDGIIAPEPNLKLKRTNRNHEVKLRYDKNERERIEKKAKELGITITQYIRMTSLNADVDVK